MIKPSQLDLIWYNHHLQRQILMIFLFFGSSIAHLEPELQQFEDRLIFAGISATGARFGFRQGCLTVQNFLTTLNVSARYLFPVQDLPSNLDTSWSQICKTIRTMTFQTSVWQNWKTHCQKWSHSLTNLFQGIHWTYYKSRLVYLSFFAQTN